MSALEESLCSESPSEVSDPKCEKKLRLTTSQGLHARPAAYIAKLLRSSRSTVTFSYKHQTVDAHSVLHLLMLGAPKNALITVAAVGVDAVETMSKLETAFEQKFGDPGL